MKLFNMGIITLIIVSALLATAYLWLRLPALAIEQDASYEDKLQKLDQWLANTHQAGKFNGTVLLARQSNILFTKSYGFADIESQHPLNEHSSYNLASVSKQFTAMGIVLLNHLGRLSYDDKISNYLPELSQYEDITLEHLLHHTSGLPDYMQLASKYHSDTSVPFTTEEMLSLFSKHKPPLEFTPGEKFRYSNTGYVLLAVIIERVSGKPFQQFMSEHIFMPLGMDDSHVFNLLSATEPANRVYGMRKRPALLGGGIERRDLNYLDGVAGDGGIYSSAYDLFLWHTALSKGTLVPTEEYGIAYQPAVLANGMSTAYGFGWFINNDNSVEHAGGWQGFASFIHRRLDNDELIVILDNASNPLRVTSRGFRFNSIALNLMDWMQLIRPKNDSPS